MFLYQKTLIHFLRRELEGSLFPVRTSAPRGEETGASHLNVSYCFKKKRGPLRISLLRSHTHTHNFATLMRMLAECHKSIANRKFHTTHTPPALDHFSRSRCKSIEEKKKTKTSSEFLLQNLRSKVKCT